MDVNLILVIIVGILSIIFGLVVITNPRIIKWLVGGYFIISGVLWILRAIL